MKYKKVPENGKTFSFQNTIYIVAMYTIYYLIQRLPATLFDGQYMSIRQFLCLDPSNLLV